MIESFDTAKHLPTLQAWCRGHGKAEFPEWWLPPVGFVVPDVVAAFLYVTPGCGLAFLECVISNPETSSSDRQQGLDEIDVALSVYCEKNHIRAVQGQTAIATVAAAAKRNGWMVTKPKFSILARLISSNEKVDQ